MKLFNQIIQQKWLYRVAVILCALVPLSLGSAWVWTFGFTNYRQHLAFIGLPLGLFCVGLGLAMLYQCRWAIICSLPLATLASLAFAVIGGISGAWSFWIVALIGGAYVALISHHFFYFRSITTTTK